MEWECVLTMGKEEKPERGSLTTLLGQRWGGTWQSVLEVPRF